MAEMVRVNTRIGANVNEWLDKYSEETGVPKSTIIHLAIEMFMQQKQAMKVSIDLVKIAEAFERLEKKIDEKN